MLLVAILESTIFFQKTCKMAETLAHRYSSESTQRELSNEYQHNRVKMVFKKTLRPYALDESSLSIIRVNLYTYQKKWLILKFIF